MKCTRCGMDLSENALFCQKCGTKIALPKINFCRECGRRLNEDAKFCTVCGTKAGFVSGVMKNGQEHQTVMNAQHTIVMEIPEHVIADNAAMNKKTNDESNSDSMSHMKYCRGCGSHLAEGTMFCTVCGTRIGRLPNEEYEGIALNKQENVETVITESEKTVRAVGYVPNDVKKESADSNDAIGENRNGTEKITNGKKKTIIGLVAILLLVLLVLLETGKGFSEKSHENSNEATDTFQEVMNVVEMPYLDARRTLQEKGFFNIVSNVEDESDESQWVVIDQSIEGGVKAGANEEIFLTCELRAEVLNVVGMPYSEALKVLQANGFSNVVPNCAESAEESKWIVKAQSITEGTKVGVGERIELTCAVRCKLYFDIASEFNLIFNTYDILVSLDGEEIGTVANGENFTYLTEVLSGQHQIGLTKRGSASPNCILTVTVSGDMTYSCTLVHGGMISARDEKIENSIIGATLEMIDVTGLVLSEAMSKLNSIGFINLREEPYYDIINKDNWIVEKQNAAVGSILDKNDKIQLDCISLDDYFANSYIGKNVKEIMQLAEEGGFSVVFAESSWLDGIGSKIESMDEATKEDWIATDAWRYGSKTSKVIIKYNGIPESSSSIIPETTKAKKTYDIDKDVVVVECNRDTEKTTMYHIAFAETDANGNPVVFYLFQSIINPRAMGKNFNAIGDLPDWFCVGAKVHLQAYMLGEYLSESNCIVSKATGQHNEYVEPTESSAPVMPVMEGTNLDDAIDEAKKYGLSRAFSDENWGHGTKMCSLSSANGGLTIDIVYCTNTKEILMGDIVTFSGISSSSEQKEFIVAMARVLCPSSDKEEVVSWVSSNVGTSKEKTIGGFTYKTGVGPGGNALFSAGEDSWEKWELSFN